MWGLAKAELIAMGHDVVWAGDWPADPGDIEILQRAYDEQRVLVTLDKDFGELAVIERQPHCGIVRLVGIRAETQAPACRSAIERYASELATRAIVTVEPGRVRIRCGDSR
jgi:predicted nuclease of predicted toxin-antitoxin system